MAKNIYVGVGGKARKVKQLYVGVAGKARKVKKVYVGVGGKARLVYVAYIPVTKITLTSATPQRNGAKSSVGNITCVFDIQPSNSTTRKLNVSITNSDSIDSQYGKYRQTTVSSNSGNTIVFKGGTDTGTYSATAKVWIDSAVCNVKFSYHSKPLFINFRYYVDISSS